MTSAAGAIIYKAFAPNLKIWICIGIGVVLTKKGLFPPASARGVSTLSLNVGLPCLIFSSMVTALSLENGSAFGGLILMAVLYEIVGLALAWALRELVYVPRDFRWGILVLGAISNWGNMPVAIVQTIGLSAPFDGTHDIQLGTAYAAVYILVMNVVLFPCGMHKLCAFDFNDKNLSQPEPEPLLKRISAFYSNHRYRRTTRIEDEEKRHTSTESSTNTAAAGQTTEEQDSQLEKTISPSSALDDHSEHGEEPTELKKRVGTTVRYGGGAIPTRKTSRASSFTSMMETTRPIPATAPLDAVDLTAPCRPTSSRVSNSAGPETGEAPDPCQSPHLAPTDPVNRTCSNHGPDYTYHQPLSPAPSIHRVSWTARVLKFLRGFIMPVTIAIFFAVPCALVPPLKALFIHVDGWTGTRMPNAPNGDPPLSFILDTTSFLGGMSVPTSLILLGASFARLKAPEKLSSLPIAAVILMTCIKMIVIPIFSIFVVQALRDSTSLYPKDDRMRSFVTIISSGTPAAINQLVLTQLYNPAGTAHTLALFLSLQYLVMPILTTAIAAIALYIVE